MVSITVPVQVIDVGRGRVTATLQGHKTRVTCLAVHHSNAIAGARRGWGVARVHPRRARSVGVA